MSTSRVRTTILGVVALALALLPVAVGTPVAHAEQASSRLGRIAAASLDAGGYHSCAILAGGSVRCWGYNFDGELGYGHANDIGDDETPAAAGPVDLGTGRTATALTGGGYHTCAILDDGTVRCWGYNDYGQLGYGHTDSIGDNETPAVGPVDLGAGRTAIAITAGAGHTCAILDNGTVRCWGHNDYGQLGHGNTASIGDNETPAAAGPVDLGTGRRAVALSAGDYHTCAILDDGTVRCWGLGAYGPLGYGNTASIGDNETPAAAGPVGLGTGRSATALAAGSNHTCAILDDGTARCWGYNTFGQLGYGHMTDIGDNETPAAAGPVDLGAGRTATTLTAGGMHTCAILDNHTVRCWGLNGGGQLGYGNTAHIGDNEAPAAAGPVDLGTGRTATTVTAGAEYTCAVLDDRTVRCWGASGDGQLGYGNEIVIGDNETPAAAGPVALAAHARTFEPPALTLGASPRRDRRPKYKYVVSGSLTGRFVRDAATCNGTATVVATTGKGRHRRVLKRTAAAIRSDCALSARIVITQRKLRTTRHRVPIRIRVSYLGNGSLQPATAIRTVRAR